MFKNSFNISFIVKLPPTEDLDLAFALTATSSSADDTFEQMKEIVIEMVNKYGRGKVQYGLIIFGDIASIKINFMDSFPTDDAIKRFIDSVPRSINGPALDEALEEARKLFETSRRPQANKVLVVISDKNSTSSPEDLSEKVITLEQQGIDDIVSVVIGNEASAEEMLGIAKNKDDVIAANSSDTPKDIADKISKRITQGKQKTEISNFSDWVSNLKNLYFLDVSYSV